MRKDCKWFSEFENNPKCGHGTYNTGMSFVYEDLMPCKSDCKGYMSRDEYFDRLKNPQEYLKKYGKMDV